jgi:hypothetical protein
MTNMYILSINKSGDCVNIEIGHEEETTVSIPHEVGQIMYQVMQLIYPMKRRITKAQICLSEDEYELLRPAVGDEVQIEVKKHEVTFKFIR